ncbi:MAG: recombinase [Actinomycetota bacterium]
MSDGKQTPEAIGERLRAENEKLLAEFAICLAESGLSPRTIRQHVYNLDLYLNHYLLYDEPLEAPRGVYHAGMFLGYWLPWKVSWTSDGTMRSHAASLHKLYSYLNERGLVSDDAVAHLRKQLRTGMPGWLVNSRRYR